MGENFPSRMTWLLDLWVAAGGRRQPKSAAAAAASEGFNLGVWDRPATSAQPFITFSQLCPEETQQQNNEEKY